MSLLTKTYDIFKKSVVALMILFVSVLFVGSWFTTSQVKLGANFHTVLLVFFWILLVLQLYWFIKWIYRFFERADEKSHRSSFLIAAVMFFVMAAGLGVVITCFHQSPTVDSNFVLETSEMLRRDGRLMPEHRTYGYMGLFKNNYTMTLLFSWLFRLFFAVGINDVLLPMFIINALCILLCVWFTWLSVKECFGIVTANKSLLLLVLNPVFYGIVEWVYSMTLALPIFSGILFCVIRIYKAKTLAGEIVFGGILGLLTVIGYLIRVTSLFPLCAALVMIVFLVFKKKIYRKALASGVAFLMMFAALWVSITPIINRPFEELADNNMPVSYWLSMGAHGAGNISTRGDDMFLARQIADPAERNKFCVERTLEHYRDNGVIETICLWSRKNIATFSEGYSNIGAYLSAGEVKSDVYYFLCGSYRFFFVTYANVFRVLTFIGILVLLIRSFSGGNVSEKVFLLILTLFGALVFYALWESKSIYSIQFLPVMIVLATLGLSEIKDDAIFKRLFANSKRRTVVHGVYAVVSFSICLSVTLILGEYTFMEYKSISGIADHEHCQPISDVDKTIEQEFTSKNEFNHFRFLVNNLDEDESLSGYVISVIDKNGEVLDSCPISDEERIWVGSRKGDTCYLTVEYDEVFQGGEYRVRIEKTDPVNKTIVFYNNDAYSLDSYRGELQVDGKGGFVSDISMDVCHRICKPYFRAPAQILFFVLYGAWAAGCYLAAVRCFYKNKKRERSDRFDK